MRAETIMSFRDLEVWREAVELSVDCYRLTDRFPSTERFGLSSQIRRSAVSIASNIAEGHSRKARGVFRHHIKIALGSEAELETQLIIAIRLRFCSDANLRAVSARRASVGRMLHALSASLKRPRKSAGQPGE